PAARRDPVRSASELPARFDLDRARRELALARGERRPTRRRARGDRGARCGGRKAADGRSRPSGRRSRRETVRGARSLVTGVPRFVPGVELSRAFYEEVVAPLLAGEQHAAALLGTGSDVLGYDTVRSTHHGWGPRLRLFR